MGRIACILVANFPIAALVRANPALGGAPLALSHSLAPHAELTVVSARARACGVCTGMTIAQARSLVPALVVRGHSPAAERAAIEALADAAQSVSPLVEPNEGGWVWLDLAGLERLYASENDVASELVRRAARVGMEAAAGIAANKEIAHLAARCGGVRVVEPGKEREFMDWLPLDVLDLDAGGDGGAAGLEATFARWGIRRLGALARLEPGAVATRLGRRGAELVRLARGEERAPLIARRAAETFAEEVALDYGVESLEPLAFVMRPMLERLAARLGLRGFAAGDIVLSLGLSGNQKFSRRVVVGAPSLEVRALLALVTLSLEASPPEAAVESIRIEAEPRVARTAQADLFLPPTPAGSRLETTLARLAALCGPEGAGTLRPANSHRPEAVRLDAFAPPPPRPGAPGGATAARNAARLVLRALRPPLEVEVLQNRGTPEFVRGPNLGARVVSVAGPWRRDGEWWRRPPRGDDADSPSLLPPLVRGEAGASERIERRAGRGQSRSMTAFSAPGPLPCPSPWTMRGSGNAVDEGSCGFRRDYYELALGDGAVYRVFRDLDSGRWFLDGVYD